MGSRLHACLPKVQRPPEECPTPTIRTRRMRRMVHACGCGGCTRPPPRVAISILCGALRHCIEYQHRSWYKYHCSRWHHWLGVYLHNIRTYHISGLAIPEFVLRPHLVSGPEIACSKIQGSELGRNSETCELEHSGGTNAACDGRDRRTQRAR